MRGMRNPLESWQNNDTDYELIGKNDLKLAQKLIAAGTSHSKFMRQIFVEMDINAPLYWWKEMDTYKVGTTANSCSTMHKLSTTPITEECFSFDANIRKLHITDDEEERGLHTDVDYVGFAMREIVAYCEVLRQTFLKTGKQEYWRALIQLLPSSWNQMRTWTANFQVLRNIYFDRKDHKLTEWREFCDFIQDMPYGKELICY